MDDLIRRSDAIEYFMTNTNWHDEEGYPIDDAEDKRALLTDYFNGVPSAQQWTPCSEGLPKTDNWRTTFNVTTEAGFVVSMKWENTTVRGKLVSRWIWQDRISPWKVVAWMPLPKPWKGSEDKE